MGAPVAFGPIGFGSMGPEGAPQDSAWTGGHNPSVIAWEYAYENFIIPSIVTEHPSWSFDQVRSAGLFELNMRMMQDREKYRGEMDRQPEMVTDWEVTETSPGIYELATSYGQGKVTLRELWDHTRKFAGAMGMPGAYNEEEAKAQLGAQDALIRGEITSFMSVLSHPEGVRYAMVWDKASDGAIQSKIVDIALTVGRDLSKEEAILFVSHMAELYQDHGREAVRTEAAYPHFMVNHGTVEVQDVKIIARTQFYASKENEQIPLRKDIVSTTADTLMDVSQKVSRDMQETALNVKEYLVSKLQTAFMKEAIEERKKRPDKTPIFLQLLQGKIHEFATSLFVPRADIINEPRQKNKKNVLNGLLFLRQKDQDAPKASNKAVFRRAIQFIWKPKDEKKDMSMSVQRQKGLKDAVGLGSLVFRQERMKKLKEKKPIRTRHLSANEKNRTGEKRHTRKIKTTILVALERTIIVHGLKKEKRGRKSELGENKLKRRERLLWNLVRRISFQLLDKPKKRNTGVLKEKRKDTSCQTIKAHPDRPMKQEIQKNILYFSFILAVWFLLNQKALSENGNQIITRKDHVEREKRLLNKEPVQWLLFAIIWYLAMIREQGKGYVVALKKKKKRSSSVIVIQRRQDRYPIPYGVIFASSS